MGKAKYILGLEILWTKDYLEISQRAYVNKILERFRMQDSRPVSTPLETGQQIREAEKESAHEVNLYQSMIGSLLYAALGSRPDIAFATTNLSQYNTNPDASHHTAVKRILRYLNGTNDFTLRYPRGNQSSNLKLECYADASYGNCLDTRRSYSGYVVQLNNATISWCSQRQKSVAVSTTEAEYMSLSLASRQIIWLKRGIIEQGFDVEAHLIGDNDGSLNLSKNPRIHSRSKHIDIHYHFVREKLKEDIFKLLWKPSDQNIADILTKSLPKATHEKFVSMLRYGKLGEVLK
jgi:hypothetical protein